MNQTKLTVTIDLEEYDAGLTGTLEVDGFRGYGEGWFNLSEIKEFIEKLNNIASSLEGEADLIGGHSEMDGSNFLERLGLRCYPIGNLGVIGVHVTLAEYPYTDCRKEEILKVSGELKTEVQLVTNFTKELDGLISGTRESATIIGRE